MSETDAKERRERERQGREIEGRSSNSKDLVYIIFLLKQTREVNLGNPSYTWWIVDSSPVVVVEEHFFKIEILIALLLLSRALWWWLLVATLRWERWSVDWYHHNMITFTFIFTCCLTFSALSYYYYNDWYSWSVVFHWSVWRRKDYTTNNKIKTRTHTWRKGTKCR